MLHLLPTDGGAKVTPLEIGLRGGLIGRWNGVRSTAGGGLRSWVMVGFVVLHKMIDKLIALLTM